ncbi:unnamed protein product, partial [Polarella glacialis]
MTAWSFAKAGVRHPKLFFVLEVAALQKMSGFSSIGLSNLVWAFATAARNDTRLCEAVATEAMPRIREFKRHALATTAWAFAKLEIYDRMLFDALGAEALPKLGEFNSIYLANILWAFAKVGRPDASLFQAAAVAALPRIGHFGAPELRIIAWAFDQADLPATILSERLFAAIVKKALKEKLIGNRYHQMGRELDIVFQAADGSLVNIEIDEVYHRTPRQRSIDSRRASVKVFPHMCHQLGGIGSCDGLVSMWLDLMRLMNSAVSARGSTAKYVDASLFMVVRPVLVLCEGLAEALHSSLRIEGICVVEYTPEPIMRQLQSSIYNEFAVSDKAFPMRQTKREAATDKAVFVCSRSLHKTDVRQAVAQQNRFVRGFNSGFQGKLVKASKQLKILLSDGASGSFDRAKPFCWPQSQQPSAPPGAASSERLHDSGKSVGLALFLRRSVINGAHLDIRMVKEAEVANLEAIDRLSCAHLSKLTTASVAVFSNRKLVWHKLAVAVQREAGGFDGDGLANIAMCFARTGRFDQDLFTALSGSAQRIGASLSFRNIANILWAFAKIGRDDPELFEALAKPALKTVNDFNPQELSNMAWAFAKAGMSHPELFRALSSAARQRIGEFSSQGLSNLVWAFATTAWSDPAPLFDAAAKVVVPRINEFSHQELAMTAWAFAKVGLRHQDLFGALSLAALQRIGEFSSQGLSNLVWAYATVAWTLQRIEEFSPQGLSNLVWAFATVAWSAPEPLCYAVAKVAFSRISEFNEHDLAMTAWAFAKTGVSHPKLFHGLAAASFLKMGNFSEQDLANIAWAFAKAGVSHPELFRALSTTALQRIGEFSSQGLSNLAWAFATTAWSVPQPVFHAVAKEALPRICEFNQLGLTMTAWAFAKVGVSHPELFKALSITALQRIDEFSSQGLSNLAWASVQADLIPTRESDQLLEAIAVRARQQNWSVLKPEFGPPSPSAVEARCAELVQQWIHGST